jgi:hypothetical protein
VSSILLTERSSWRPFESKISNSPLNHSANLPRFVAKMGFLSQLCTCCDRSVRVSDERSGSYVRVVNINGVPRGSSQRRSSISVPQPATRDEKAEYTQLLISIDEKDSDDFESLPPSPYSSVVSIPSTHVTALTSSYTGGTSARNSQQYEGSPPSYHSERSPSPSPPTSRDSQHPVMNSNWLEILQRAAYKNEGSSQCPPTTNAGGR